MDALRKSLDAVSTMKKKPAKAAVRCSVGSTMSIASNARLRDHERAGACCSCGAQESFNESFAGQKGLTPEPVPFRQFESGAERAFSTLALAAPR